MSIFESLFYMLWRGIAIGLFISAPMGPVGILCIQRTLNKGRKAGFYTGVGAAISDLFYCLLTGFGLSFIEDFLQRNSAIIQIIGSVVLIGFSIYLFKKNPARDLRRPDAAEVSTKKSILAGFLFTFSNPLILFLTIGLFARFNFMMAEFKFYHYILGYIAILAGALGWWWLVTFFIDKVRSHFNLRSMWLINKIIGAIVLLFAIVGIFTAISALAGGSKAIGATHTPHMLVNSERGFNHIGGDSLIYPGENCNIQFFSNHSDIDIRICIKSGSSPWRMTLQEGKDTESALFFDFIPKEISDGVSTVPHLEISAISTGLASSPILIPYGNNLSIGFNLFTLQRRGRHFTLSIGHRHLEKVLDFDLSGSTPPDTESLSIAATGKKSVEISSLEVVGFPGIESVDYYPVWSYPSEVKEYLRKSIDPMEGCWIALDGSFEESLARKGGDYKLLSIADPAAGDNHYLLIYIDGAVVHSSKWKSGMVKAKLCPTGANGVWDVSWTDSEGCTMHRNVRAQTEDHNLLTIHFPFQQSVLRFQRILP